MEIEQPTAPTRRDPAGLASVWAPRLIIACILLLGAYFRTLSLTTWDAGTGQHPDERFFSDVASSMRLPGSLGELYDSARSPMNPRNYDRFPLYVYGPFPQWITRAVAVALTPPETMPATVPSLNGPPRMGADPAYPNEMRTDYGPAVPNPEYSFPRLSFLLPIVNPDGVNLTGYGEIQKVGRSLAVLFDLGSIVLVYLIGRRLFRRRVGLVAALLLALAVMPIQQSHFFVDPIFSTFFCLLSLYWAVRVAQGGAWPAYALLGLSIGAAMANRITMATLGGVAVVAALIAAVRYAQGEVYRAEGERPPGVAQLAFYRFFGRELMLLVLAGALTFLSFRTLAPDAFVGSRPDSPAMSASLLFLQGAGFLDVRPEPRFLGNLSTVSELVSGAVDFPPSQQWVGRPPYVFPWQNMVLWGMGPALGLAAWGSLAAFALMGLRRLLWPRADDPPLSPAWAVAVWVAFYFTWQGGQLAITLRYLLPIYGGLIIFAAWGLVRLWEWRDASATNRAAGDHHTGRDAGPPRQRSLGERLRWAMGAGVPVAVVLLTLGWAYAFSRIYTLPHSRVMAAQWLADHAPPGSYVMFETWDDPLPLQVTQAQWGATFEGISSAPYAEDEPRKYVGGPSGSGTFDEGLLDQLDRADYITLTSNRVYDSTSRLRMRYPALMRYYHHLFSGELGFRLAAEVTSYPTMMGIQIPDQGAEEAFHVYDHPRVLIFEKTPAYSRARAENLIIDDTLWGEVYKSPVNIADRNPTALRLTDGQWARYAEGGVGAGAFSRERWVNAVAPLLWLGVLQLLGLAAFALLFHLLPWLPDRGYSLSKTLGLLAVAYLAWLAGSLGNNTGVPGHGNVGGVGWGPFPLPFTPATVWLCATPLLAAGATAAWLGRDGLGAFWRERRRAILWAEGIFLGFLLFGLLLRWLNPDLWHPARGGEKPMELAHLMGVLRSAAFPPLDPWHAGGYLNYYYFGSVLVGTLTHMTTVAPSIAFNLGVATVLGLTALGAWGLVYNLLAPRHEGRALAAATLAPALLLLLGNMAQTVWLVNGYAVEQWVQGRLEWAYWDATRIVQGTVNEFPYFTFLFGDLHAHMIVMPLSLALLGLTLALVLALRAGAWWRLGAGLLLAGLLAGSIRATNTWDYPTFVGLAALTLAGAGWRAGRGGMRWPWRVILVALPPITMVLVGNLLFAPFVANFATESSGAELWREGLAPGPLTGILLAQRTTMWELTLLYGHWLLVACAAGLLLAWRMGGPVWAGVAAGALALIYAAGLALSWPALILLLPALAIAAWLLWLLRRAPLDLLLPALWLAGGLGLIAMVEVVTVRGDIGRMNTVFKFGLHAWMLFALGVAALLPRLWEARGWARYAVRGGLVTLGVAALAYPLTATPARAGDRWVAEAPRGLDGAAFMAAVSAERNGATYALDEDAAAIAWLQDNVAGAPVIVEAHLPSYQWAGRVASNTGLPTILGWEWHQVQQRNAVGAGPTIASRQQTVATIFNTPDAGTALELLRQYGVRYVYVGGVERATYTAEGLAKFEVMAAAGALEPVFQQGQTTIYRVVQPGEPRMLTSDLPVVAPTLDTPPPLMLDRPVNQLPAVDEFAWNRAMRDSSLLSALLWLVFFYAVGLLGLPVAHLVFRHWRDGGAAWARPIGLMLLGYAVWLPTSLGLWQYDVWGLLSGLALVLALNVVALWWLGAQDEGSADDVTAAQDGRPPLLVGLAALALGLKARRRSVLRSEAVFLVGFLTLALLRAFNPDLWHQVWGGEKPMELGFLNAILRSPVMPPYDPFFSGGYINYYYYGLFLMSLPIKATGIAPAVGFNMAVATAFAMTLAAAFALANQLTGRARYGLLAAALVGVLGNLTSFFAAGWAPGFPAVWSALAEGGLAGFGKRLGDWFIGPSRVVPNTINEFPAFTFLFADLHPHMIALPLTILAAALGYVLVTRTAPRRFALPLLALTLGTLAVTNSWDFPTYGLLAGLAMLGAAWREGGPRARGVPWGGLALAALLGVGVGVGGLAMFAPFFDRYWAPVGGVGRVAWGDGTLVSEYLLIYGLAVAVLLPVLAGALWRTLGRRTAWQGSSPAALGIRSTPALGGAGLALAGLIALGAAAVLAPAVGLRLALAALLLAGLSLLLRRRLSAPVWYGLLLAWVGWAVSLGVELVYIRDHLAGGDWYRMNTVFKFGLQVWVLLALAATAMLPALVRGLRRVGGAAAAGAGLAILGVLAALAAIYPLAGVPSRVANRFPVSTGLTLDGLAFMDQTSFDYDCNAFGGCEPGAGAVTIDLRGDAAAIRWLNDNISGTPIVVQSNLFFYRGFGIRIAASTGLPTVVSALHVNEQRAADVAARRDAEVTEFYRTTDVEAALRFLARYQVNYVYVGGVERAIYPASGLAKFAQLSGSYLTPVYATPEVQIYAVTGVPDSYARPEPVDFASAVPSSPPPQAFPRGETPAGLAELEEANRASPTDGPTAFGLAERYRAMGRLADAAAVLEPAARANPGDMGVLHLWGDILSEAGRTAEAEEAFMLAIEADPSAGNWNKLGTALLSWGQLDKAELALLQARATDAQAPDPYFRLGQLMAQRGNATQAREELETYLLLAPDGPWAEEARKMLAELGA